MTEKATGYALLVFGLLIIAFAGFSVYQVVTKKAEPVSVFNFSGVSLDLGSMLPPESQELKIEKNSLPQMQLITPEMINETSNLFLHIFLMGFTVNIGYKVASLGVTLIRPIQVKLKESVIK